MTKATRRTSTAHRSLLLCLVATALVTAFWAPHLGGLQGGFAPLSSIREMAFFLSRRRFVASSSSIPFSFLFGDRTAPTRARNDCFSPNDPVLFVSAGPGHDDEVRPQVLRRLPSSRREAGRYRDRFSMRVSLDVPSLREMDVIGDGGGGGGGDDDDDYAYAAVGGELVIVTDTTVATTGTTDPDERPRVELVHQEVTSRATATTVTATSSREKEGEADEQKWVEVCHGTTTTQSKFTSATTEAARSGLGLGRGGAGKGFLRGQPQTQSRRLLSLSSLTARPPFGDDPICASLLSAAAGGWTSATSLNRPAGSTTDVGGNVHGGTTILDAARWPATATILADRYLEAIPGAHAIRPGDSWPVVLPRVPTLQDPGEGLEDGAEEAGPRADGPSLTGVATFLGYQSSTSSSSCRPDNSPTDIAVIQVRGTESIEDGGDWLEAVRATVRQRTGPPPPSMAAVSLVPGDAVLVATLYFDVTTQRVRHVTVDQTFVLHATLSDGWTTAIPVKGTAVLETWRLGTP